MKYKLPACALLLCLLCLAAAPPAHDRPAVKHVVNKTVTVSDGDEEVGSGVVIRHGEKTYVLTCAHVASEFVKDKVWFKRVTLTPYRGARGRGSVEWMDSKRDVALIEVRGGLKIDPVVIDPEAVVGVDDDVYYCGCGVKPFNLQRTWVATLLPKEGALGLGIGGWYGHSGSGVFRKDGWKLVGMVQGAWEDAGRLVRAIDLKTILASLKDYDDASVKERTQAGGK